MPNFLGVGRGFFLCLAFPFTPFRGLLGSTRAGVEPAPGRSAVRLIGAGRCGAGGGGAGQSLMHPGRGGLGCVGGQGR